MPAAPASDLRPAPSAHCSPAPAAWVPSPVPATAHSCSSWAPLRQHPCTEVVSYPCYRTPVPSHLPGHLTPSVLWEDCGCPAALPVPARTRLSPLGLVSSLAAMWVKGPGSRGGSISACVLANVGARLGELPSAPSWHLSTCLVLQTLFEVMFKESPMGLPTTWPGTLLPSSKTMAGSCFEKKALKIYLLSYPRQGQREEHASGL